MLINIIQKFFYKPLNVLNDINLLNFIDSSTSYFNPNNIYYKDKLQINYKCSDENNCEFNNINEKLNFNLTINLIIDIIKRNSSFFVCKSLGGIVIDNVYYKNTNLTIDKKYIFLMVIDTELFMNYINEFNGENMKIISKYYDDYNNKYIYIINIYKNICNMIYNIFNYFPKFFIFKK